MCLKCKLRESAPDFGETLVEILEPGDLSDYPQFFGRAVLAWLSDLEHSRQGPECMSCKHTFTPEEGAAALVCVVPPTARHLFITGVCAECFPVIGGEQLAAHVSQVVGLPRAIRQSYN